MSLLLLLLSALGWPSEATAASPLASLPGARDQKWAPHESNYLPVASSALVCSRPARVWGQPLAQTPNPQAQTASCHRQARQPRPVSPRGPSWSPCVLLVALGVPCTVCCALRALLIPAHAPELYLDPSFPFYKTHLCASLVEVAGACYWRAAPPLCSGDLPERALSACLSVLLCVCSCVASARTQRVSVRRRGAA